jgi:protocatechuate 3,4-dioxygenase beta subunit
MPSSSDSSKCRPTPQLAWGPLYFPGHPLLNNAEGGKICRGEDDGQLMLASSIFSRQLVDVGSVQLTVSGQVLDESCHPVPGAIVDVWSPDSRGRYSLTADGECRGAVRTDDEGRYQFLTHLPGSYGVTAGCGYSALYGMELPPYSLRHIHVAVFAPGHKVLVTQLTFPDDPTRGKDFREFLAPDNLSDPDVELTIRDMDDGTHATTFDFVVQKDPTLTTNLFGNATALRDVVCVADGLDLGEPYPLCQTDTPLGRVLSIKGVATVLLPAIFYGMPGLVLLVISMILRKILSKKDTNGSTSTKKKKKSV